MSKVNPIILSDIETISEDEMISEEETILSEEEIPKLLDEQDEQDEMAFFTKHLSVPEVVHSAFPIEYPKTSPQGVATIFNISGWSDPMACLNDVSILIIIT
jgi:hypothetical protein